MAPSPSPTRSRVSTTSTEAEAPMNPDQERDFIERQVDLDISRRHFMRWAGKAGLSGVAATALSGSILAACSSSGKKDKVDANAPKTGDTSGGGFSSTG